MHLDRLIFRATRVAVGPDGAWGAGVGLRGEGGEGGRRDRGEGGAQVAASHPPTPPLTLRSHPSLRHSVCFFLSIPVPEKFFFYFPLSFHLPFPVSIHPSAFFVNDHAEAGGV